MINKHHYLSRQIMLRNKLRYVQLDIKIKYFKSNTDKRSSFGNHFSISQNYI